MSVPLELLTMAASGLASALLIGVMLASGRSGALDQPNQRSLHSQPVPRSGGLGVLVAVAIGLMAASAPIWLAAATVLLAAVSWLDDQKHLPILLRIAGHFCAAGIVAWNGGLPPWSVWAVVAALFAMVWTTNLYNFMDGIDGLAGGMAVCGFGTLALAAQAAGAGDIAILAGCIAAGGAGFLVFNFHPARIFLGDVGSIPLGFLAAVVSVDGVRRELWPLWFPVVAFSPFMVDASLTLLRRTLGGERVWQAHREHYYQRLVRMGWGHRRTALAEYALMAGMAAMALFLRTAPTMLQFAGLVVVAAVYAVLGLAVDRRWRRWCRAEAVAVQ